MELTMMMKLWIIWPGQRNVVVTEWPSYWCILIVKYNYCLNFKRWCWTTGVVGGLFLLCRISAKGKSTYTLLTVDKGFTKDMQDVIEFIDKYISCSKPTIEYNEEMSALVANQMHRHSQTCPKGRKLQCHLGFPKPPMASMVTLEPLPADMDVNEKSSTQESIHSYSQRIENNGNWRSNWFQRVSCTTEANLWWIHFSYIFIFEKCNHISEKNAQWN